MIRTRSLIYLAWGMGKRDDHPIDITGKINVPEF